MGEKISIPIINIIARINDIKRVIKLAMVYKEFLSFDIGKNLIMPVSIPNLDATRINVDAETIPVIMPISSGGRICVVPTQNKKPNIDVNPVLNMINIKFL